MAFRLILVWFETLSQIIENKFMMNKKVCDNVVHVTFALDPSLH